MWPRQVGRLLECDLTRVVITMHHFLAGKDCENDRTNCIVQWGVVGLTKYENICTIYRMPPARGCVDIKTMQITFN